MNKVAKFSIGSIIAGVIAFLSVHFNITPKDDVGAGILALLGYLAAAITHGGSKPQPPAQIFKALLLPFLLLAPAALHAQADSAKHYRFEFGTDAVMRTDSVTAPQSVRIGLLLGKAFTVEYRASAARDEGYLEATVDLGVTAAIMAGSSNQSGQYVEPLLSYHYDGGPAQIGVGFEVGTRTQTIGPMAIRASMFTVDYFATKRLPAVTSVGARVGVSFWR